MISAASHPLLGVALCVLAGCSAGRTADTRADPWKVHGDVLEWQGSSPPDALHTATARQVSAATLKLGGRVVWTDEFTARVYTPFNGRVEAMLVQPGDRVRRGQPLLRLSSADYGQAQAEERKAAATMLAARRNHERSQELLAAGVAARKDAEQAEADWRAAEAEWQRAHARLRSMGETRDVVDGALVLRSPLDGIVVERTVTAGTEVRADASAPLFVISDPSALSIALDVPEAVATRLAPGQEFHFHSAVQADVSGIAKLTQVGAGVDPLTRAVRVRGRVLNATRPLRGDAYIEAELPLHDGAPAVAVPADAVLLVDDRHYVFVVEGRRYTRRPVTLDTPGAGVVTLESGVMAGQTVISDGALYLEQLLEAAR